MARTVIKANLYELNQVTPTMRELKLKIVDGQMKFRAGQFVMLLVPVEGQPKPVQRAYSIASSADDAEKFVILFKHVPGGVASEFVAKLKGGETLDITGPWGKCFLKTPAADQIIFVSTGSGLSQHYSYLTSEAKNWPNTKFHMLIGVSNETEMYYLKELDAAKAKYPNFDYKWCLSRPSENWKERKGRVTSFIHDFDFKSGTSHVYLCGSGAMIKEMKKILIEEKGLPTDHIVAESFD